MPNERTISLIFGLPMAAVACSPAVSATPSPTTGRRAAEPTAEREDRCASQSVQAAAEDALESAGDPGTVVVLDVGTGERLVTTTTEPDGIAPPPGSTVKPLLALAGLSHGVLTPNETVACEGKWRHDEATLTCHGVHGALDVGRALATSCNVLFYELASRLGPEKIAKQVEDLGLDDFGRQIRDAPVDDLGFMATAIGHGDAQVKPRDLAEAYRRLLAASDPNMASIQSGMLAAVEADDGTGRKAAVDGLAVAGKTGTADEPVDGVAHTHAWFVGYAPADEPSVVVAVHVDGEGTGGQVAAPIASAVLQSWRDACFEP